MTAEDVESGRFDHWDEQVGPEDVGRYWYMSPEKPVTVEQKVGRWIVEALCYPCEPYPGIKP